MKPKTIRDENLKRFITILSDICKKYKSVNSPKYGIYGKAINSITTLGTTEFKKRIKNGEKIPYFGPKLTEMYLEFVKTGKVDISKYDKDSKKTVETQLIDLRKQMSNLKKQLKQSELSNKPRVAKRLVDEISTVNTNIKTLKQKLLNMSDISDNTFIDFNDLMSILSDRLTNL